MRSLHGLTRPTVDSMTPVDVAAIAEHGRRMTGEGDLLDKLLAPWCDGDFRLMYLNAQVTA